MLNRSKKKLFLLLIFGLLISIMLLFLKFSVFSKNNSTIIYVYPKVASEKGISVKNLEKINEEKFILTYEVIENGKIENDLRSFSGKIITTNYTNYFVNNYLIRSGNFFTKTNQEEYFKNENFSYATINETAAFKVFGGNDCIGNNIKINGKEYNVTGVVDDLNAKDINIYIPINSSTKSINSFKVLKNSDFYIELFKSEIKIYGVSSENYLFLDYEKK